MSESNLPSKLLFVDDDPTIAKGLEPALAKHSVNVLGAKDSDTAFYQFNQNRIEVACVEKDFESQPGLIIIQKWRQHEMEEKRMLGVVLMLGNRADQSPEDLKLIRELRDIETIQKPFSAIQLLPVLARAKANRARAMRYQELKATAFKLGTKQDKLEKAISMIQKQLPETGPRGLEMMAELYETHGRIEDAINIYDGLLDKDNNNTGYQSNLARLLLKAGRAPEALQLMEKADTAAPDNIDRMASLTDMYLESGQPDKAVNKMRRLIDVHPEKADMKFDMVSKLYDNGYDSHAVNLCKDTSKPIEVVRYYNNKGVALKSVGNIDGALLEYDRSLMVYPKFKENYRIYYNIALAHVAKKNRASYELALEFLDKTLAQKPDFEKASKIRKQVQDSLSKKSKSKAS